MGLSKNFRVGLRAFTLAVLKELQTTKADCLRPSEEDILSSSAEPRSSHSFANAVRSCEATHKSAVSPEAERPKRPDSGPGTGPR